MKSFGKGLWIHGIWFEFPNVNLRIYVPYGVLSEQIFTLTSGKQYYAYKEKFAAAKGLLTHCCLPHGVHLD